MGTPSTKYFIKDESDLIVDFRTTNAFRKFVKAVLAVIVKKKKCTYRDLNEKLNRDRRIFDAIEELKAGGLIREVGKSVQISVFVATGVEISPLPKQSKREFNNNHFPKREILPDLRNLI